MIVVGLCLPAGVLASSALDTGNAAKKILLFFVVYATAINAEPKLYAGVSVTFKFQLSKGEICSRNVS